MPGIRPGEIHTPWHEFWRRFRRQPVAMCAGIFVLLLIAVAIVAPWIAPYDAENYFDYDRLNEGPSLVHWFGVDSLGRDIFSRVLVGAQISLAAGVLAVLIGAASGTIILGALMDKLRPVVMSLLIYTGMLASPLALGTVSSMSGMLMAGFVAGMFATGGQSVRYALAPLFYSTQIRATGVGTAVAVGRLGAMSGPLLAGKMLALGTGRVGVMAASAPGILLAGLAVFILMSRKSQMPIPASDA